MGEKILQKHADCCGRVADSAVMESDDGLF